MIWEETIKWLVYDCDGHEDFADSVKVAREYGFRVAFSQAQIDLVNKAIELYNKKAQGAEFWSCLMISRAGLLGCTST